MGLSPSDSLNSCPSHNGTWPYTGIRNRANDDCCTPDVRCPNELCCASKVVDSKMGGLAKNLALISLRYCQLDRKHIKQGSCLSERNWQQFEMFDILRSAAKGHLSLRADVNAMIYMW